MLMKAVFLKCEIFHQSLKEIDQWNSRCFQGGCVRHHTIDSNLNIRRWFYESHKVA